MKPITTYYMVLGGYCEPGTFNLLGLLGAGASHVEILEDYPFLVEEDILAALDYAAIQTDHPILIAA